MSNSIAWHVLQTEPQREATAAGHLIGYRFDIYLPVMAVLVAAGRRSRREQRPLFPGYLFVRVAPERMRLVYSVPGSRGLLREAGGGEGSFAVIGEGAIDWIREQEKSIARRVVENPTPFAVGDQVRFAEGPLQGKTGPIEALADAERITVLINLLGRATPVVTAAHSLEAL